MRNNLFIFFILFINKSCRCKNGGNISTIDIKFNSILYLTYTKSKL